MSAALSSEAKPTPGSSMIARVRATGLCHTSPRPSLACPSSVTGRPAPLAPAPFAPARPALVPLRRSGIPRVSTAESKNVPALTISASQGPPTASRIPPSAGPTASAVFEPIASSALALARFSRPTIRGILPRPAGKYAVANSVAIKTRTTTAGHHRTQASAPNSSACAKSQDTISRLLSKRSAIAPASGPSRRGRVNASSRTLIPAAPPPSRYTCTVSATLASWVPASETVRPPQNSRNPRLRASKPWDTAPLISVPAVRARFWLPGCRSSTLGHARGEGPDSHSVPAGKVESDPIPLLRVKAHQSDTNGDAPRPCWPGEPAPG